MNYEFHGRGKTLHIDDDGIKIEFGLHRRGMNKYIPYNQIVSIQIQKPGLLSGGCIFFQTIGSKGSHYTTRYQIAEDDNSIFFGSSEQYAVALEIKEAIEKKLASLSTAGR